jgi:thiamine-monophosphate kinase
MRRGKDGSSGEDRMIARYFAPIATHPGALGLSDDAACLTPPEGHDLVVTADALVAGVHFFADDPPDKIARKALRANLSDLAAKGATPAGFLLSLALAKDCGDPWLRSFARGLKADAKEFACPLLGGDSVWTPGRVTIAITAFGTLPKGSMVKRRGARAGDVVLVTGAIGDAALGLKLRTDKKTARRWKLSARQEKHLRDRYLVPQPRNALAEALREHATAAMDVSDGLAGDLAKLCRVSGVSAQIEAARVPLSSAAQAALAADATALELILTGGDDYEVVCTVPPGRVASFQAAAKAIGVSLSEIGVVTPGTRAPAFRQGGRNLAFKRQAFSHF